MSSASSEQSCALEGAGYDKVFSSGQNDPDTSYDERDPLANSPSTEVDDLDVDDSEEDSNDGHIDIGEPPPPHSVRCSS